MNYLTIISQILLYTFAVGFVFWLVRYAVSFYVFSKRKEEINKLEARVSILKLHLKGKIKRKSSKIESALSKEHETYSKLLPKLKTICDLEFHHQVDYQNLVSNLFEITLTIDDHIKIKHKNLLRMQPKISEPAPEALSPDRITEEKCKKLIKYDKAHMIIIIEIIQATNELIQKIHDYNVLVEYEKGQKKIDSIPEKIEIENFTLISELVEKAKTQGDSAPDFPILEKNPLVGAA